VDYIKIDGQFVRDIVQDEMDFAIVKSINEVGHVLGKQTIAEGVENADVARRLQMIGVDWAQGFHLSQPQLLAEWLQRFDIAYEPVVMVE
jgi:EAL domain-containing protein (putative c-di-GMP-specific phosphodiesterase class I)